MEVHKSSFVLFSYKRNSTLIVSFCGYAYLSLGIFIPSFIVTARKNIWKY